MTRLSLVLLAGLTAVALSIGALAAAAGVPTDISGTWTGRSMSAGDGFPVARPAPASLIVTRNGADITGGYSGEYTGGEARSSRIEGLRLGEDGRITFWLRDSQNYLVTAHLAVSGDWIRGRMTTSTGRVMNIALKKQ